MGDLSDEMIEAADTVPICTTCASERVVREALVCWNRQSGIWELEAVLDQARCQVCESETTLDWRPSDPAKPVKRVMELNDLFRTTGQGQGTFLITSGVQALGAKAVGAILEIVKAFSEFPPESDPWEEHDFGAFDYEGERIFWKIDCYNLDQTAGSPNPANPAVTYRVLTVLLANEW